MAIKGITKEDVVGVDAVKASDDLLESMIVRDSGKLIRSRNALVIGVQASWKTSSLRTIPQEIIQPDTGETVKAKVLFLDADDRGGVIDPKDIPHFTRVRLPYNPRRVVETNSLYNKIIERLESREWDYNVIILDTLSPLNFTMFDLAYEPRYGLGGDIYNNEYKGSERQYGFMVINIRKILFSLMGSCDYFFLLAHEKEPFYLDDDVQKKKYHADTIGRLKDMLPKMFAEVYFTTYVERQWMWATKPIGMRESRSMYQLPSVVPQDYSIITNGNWKQYVEKME